MLYFTKKPESAAGPAAVIEDKVIRMHFFDDGPLWRAFILYSLFVFDDVLDADKLYESLERLVRRDGWCKLGARLRRNKKGNLEYHIPQAYSLDRPALAYTHVQHPILTADHPLASAIPLPSTRPAVVCHPDDFHELMKPPGAPLKLEDYINSDRPQLGLHIVSFLDATLVTLYWPHTLFDAQGKRAVLDAWILMVQGRDDEVRPPCNADEDTFATLGTNPTEQHKLVEHRMGTFGLVGYVLGQVGELFRKQETRMVCVPRAFLEQLRETSLADRAAAGEDPFVSEGDVLCAWWTRFAIAHLPTNSTQTVMFNNAYCVRKVLTPDIIPAERTYLSNAIGFINMLVPVQDIVSKPISWLAGQYRKAIVELGTREQVEAFYGMVRESAAKLPPFFGDRAMHMLTFSNWTKARLFEVDFSAAVVRRGNSEVQVAEMIGRPRYIQNNQFGLTLPNAFPIIGKDNNGNYWLSGYMNKGHWDKIEELLAGLQ
ncbi:hypothetical protein GQ53DRAFT_643335 [Thozetella sp. PMI_491]|nr:hypothetical protein GQ53DRAFT_643335 [Thozetella sp. PMI_491]